MCQHLKLIQTKRVTTFKVDSDKTKFVYLYFFLLQDKKEEEKGGTKKDKKETVGKKGVLNISLLPCRHRLHGCVKWSPI